MFVITDDNSLCVADDADLNVTERICQFAPTDEQRITFCNDLAYNYADGKLYVQYYSEYNREARPFLATIDMDDGELNPICELPVDVNTMAWDHNEDKLYWAYPNTFLEIDPKTAEVTVIAEQEAKLVGLYTRPGEDEGMFDPVDRVDRIELSHTNTRIVLDNSMNLEATVWPWYASDRGVTWTSSDKSVATVNEDGRVTATGIGECVITAASRLDPTKTASCTVSTFRHEKTLQAIIWDEESQVFMSEFNTDLLPDYQKLTEKPMGIDLAAATMGQDGYLYAASIYIDAMRSDLYRLDPETFEITMIGPSGDAYVDLAPAPMSAGEVRKDLVYVDVTLPDTGTNAELTVSFNTDLLELTDVSSNAAAFAWKAEDGKVRLALAEAGEISGTRNVARLTFRALGGGDTNVCIVTDYLSADSCGQEECLSFTLEAEKPHEHVYKSSVTAPTCTEVGYTTYTCTCGDSYIDDRTDPLGNDWKGTGCSRCDETRENPFADVPDDSFYIDPVLWAVEKEITNGMDATHFGPTLNCNRAQVVTFLWRTQGTPDSAAQTGFPDVKPGAFYTAAVAWAVENDITNGMDDGTFGVDAVCNRAQAVTFLYRTLA